MRFLSLSVYSTKVIFLLRKISLLIRRFNVDYVLGYQYNDKASAGGGWEGKKKKDPAERFWLFGRISPEKKGKIRRKSRGPLAAFEN